MTSTDNSQVVVGYLAEYLGKQGMDYIVRMVDAHELSVAAEADPVRIEFEHRPCGKKTDFRQSEVVKITLQELADKMLTCPDCACETEADEAVA